MNTKRSGNDDVFASFIVAVFRLNTALLAAGDALVEPVHQTSARWRVLGPISKKPLTVAQIARSIGYARQSVQRVSDLLVEEGFVRYIDNPGDKRAQLLTLTARGETVLAQIRRRQHIWFARLQQVLEPDRLARLTASLDDVSQIIEEDQNR